MSGGSPLNIGPSVGEVMGQTPSTGLRHSSIKCGHGYVGWFSGRSVGEVMGMSGGSPGDRLVRSWVCRVVLRAIWSLVAALVLRLRTDNQPKVTSLPT